ncbi:putative RNA-directed DNA polymerase [Rosa chinensis]|uniref:Putative RNA-directed DNA polymerase n=1 Tax=Rosa chinensis TaxID=74649 RepID=A0A2P6PYV3_ROSCH|nr:putative RNA-directed DNA polymerase [Rosa chinensis]
MSEWHHHYYPEYEPDLDYYINGPSREPQKFNGKGDFRLWEVEVCDILGYEGVVEALDGKPDSMKQGEWKVFDEKACSILRFYLSEEVQNKVVAEKSSKDILEKLERLYLKKESFIERISLKMQLYKMRMDESTTSLRDHLEEFNRRVTELSEFEVELSEEDKVSILLASLPEKYNNLVMGMLYAKDSVDCYEVEEMLLFNDNRNAVARNQNRNAEAKAGVTKDQGSCGGSKSSSGSSKSRNHKVVECHYCHEIGHVLNHCPKLELKKARNMNF